MSNEGSAVRAGGWARWIPVFFIPAAIFVAGIVISGWIFVRFFTSINEGEIRFLGPGQQTLTVETSQRYHVWYYTAASLDGKLYESRLVPGESAHVVVRTGNDRTLAVAPANANKSVAGERAESLGSFATGPATEVTVAVDLPENEQAVIGVGKLEIGKKVGMIFGAVIICLASFLLAAVVGVVLGIRRYRRQQVATAPTG